MPVALLFFRDKTIPAILYADTIEGVLQKLTALRNTPDLASKEEATNWLLSQPEPSGWFDTIDAAKARLAQFGQVEDVTPDQIKEARETLGLSQEEFARALGVGGNANTQKMTTFNLEKGKQRMNPQRIAKMRRLLAQKGIEGLAK